MNILAQIVGRLPPTWIRKVGLLQHHVPVVGQFIGWVGRRALATEGVIRHGVGAGLRFNAAGSAGGYLLGTSEPQEQVALANYLHRGQVFYDIGANVGFFATLGGHFVGKTGKVYAFEPGPLAAAVWYNARLNGFNHVEVIPVAVGAKSGTANFIVSGISGMNAVNRNNIGDIVPIVSIDDFAAAPGIRPPDVVMIDVEGMEIDVLQGMAATLKRHRPIILCEVHWIGEQFLAYCRDNLEPLGYRVRPLIGERFPDTPLRFHAILEPVTRSV